MNSTANGVAPEKISLFKTELAAAQATPGTFPDTLKEAVCNIVDDLKANGKQPEEVIIEIRKLCLEAGIATSHYTSGQTNRGIAGLVDKIISSCIEHYYA